MSKEQSIKLDALLSNQQNNMPRHLQTGPRCGRTVRRHVPTANADAEVVSNPDLDEQEAIRLKEIEEGAMRAELKHIDKKFTEQGQIYYAETLEEEIPEQVNWWSKFALCLVRHMAGDVKRPWVQKVSLHVNSQHLKDILKKTIEHYPGISFATKDVAIDSPYHVLFYYRHELAHAGRDLEEGSEASQHLNLLVDFIDERFKEVIEESENLLPQGMVSYSNLWTIFRPGCTVYGAVFGQPRAFTLKSVSNSVEPPGLQLNLSYVDFDGDDMGTRATSRLVAAFPGAEKISELSAFPIEWHPQKEQAKRQLIARGRLWEQYAGMNLRHYKGIALEYTQCGIRRYNMDGRVVVDTATFHRLNANFAFSVEAFKADNENRAKRRRIQDEDDDENVATLDLVPEKTLDLDPLTEEQCLLANSMVRGFSFTEKKWLDFFVDRLAPINWNPNCFDELVLPSAQKDLVKALVATHIEQRVAFDDIVAGKGKGLILVLHGTPGTGKTLTAETVAEYSQRPLYMVSSGDLGTDSAGLDERLTRILDMASTWKAILLIDEADVFLERRSLHDMQRNSLVSIFLRVLEYYEGILFLTSNRVATFDDAFKSRIHVPLKYAELTAPSRQRIWKNFLGKLGADEVLMGEPEYERLAAAEINGRQIKNVVRTAKSLARFHGKPLNLDMLEQVIEIQREFELELESTSRSVERVDGVNGVWAMP
ncbi:P-loop containing nucleoside triphosphate hydrolase protein [Neohortaea acidophila]|uniref:P-loop containing nucleoside triphosphate hydrolase protein n=1 Tax=Neohortaea acidophila TaxID=245834 RepID=A0A6A6PJU2_9PEZI|nr:P-loop containing nucleoside triphosphate hydrolase protein [Neohortaea acidophila]KAF2479971.1 P-loop containing nucleoside triphosphate hydrolase protein [Neohortaea acidophila]